MAFRDYASYMLREGKDAELLRERSREYETERKRTEALQPVIAAIDALQPDQVEIISTEAAGIKEKAALKFDHKTIGVRAYAGHEGSKLSLVLPVDVNEDSLYLEAAMLGHYQDALGSSGNKVRKSVIDGHVELTVDAENAREAKKIMAALIEQPEAMSKANVKMTIEYGSFASLQGERQRALYPSVRELMPAPAETEQQAGFDAEIIKYISRKGRATRAEIQSEIGRAGHKKTKINSTVDKLKGQGYVDKTEVYGGEFSISEEGKARYGTAKRTKQPYATSDGTLSDHVYSFIKSRPKGATAAEVLSTFEGENAGSVRFALYTLKRGNDITQEGRGAP